MSASKQPEPPVYIYSECKNDSDCFIGGCSSQICSNKQGIVSTCQYADYYSCYKLTKCGCVQGKCQWESNAQFDSCMIEKGPKMH
jgi:eight-cysteine-cluster-containing protein